MASKFLITFNDLFDFAANKPNLKSNNWVLVALKTEKIINKHYKSKNQLQDPIKKPINNSSNSQ